MHWEYKIVCRLCTFECTFCTDCVDTILQNVCPNCGGGFEKRPIRPNESLRKYPPIKEKVFKPVDIQKFESLFIKNRNTLPSKR